MENTKPIKKGLGLFMCSFTYTFERAAYYASKWLIVIFLTTALVKGGLGITSGDAGIMQAQLVAWTYLAPVLLGFIADYFVGARYLIPLGLIIMGVGYYQLGMVGTKDAVWIMIVLVSLGTGFFKTNLAAVTGQLFDDPGEKDAAFSTQYSFVNVGSFIGTTAVGILYMSLADGSVLGFLPCFKLAGVLCFLGAAWFVLTWKFIGDIAKKPFAKGKEAAEKKESRPLAAYEKRRVGAIVLISLFSIVFWTFWYLTYLAVYDYAPKYIALTFNGFAVPTSWFDSENAFLCIILGPVLAALWLKLSHRPKGDMSLFKKLALGLFLLAMSFLMLIGAEFQRGVGAPESSKASILWIVMFGVLLTLGEMVFSPLGNAFISKYAPKRILSTLMGVWTIATFAAAQAYGFIYNWTTKHDFFNVYIGIIVVLVALAAILVMFDKKLASLVELREGEVLLED